VLVAGIVKEPAESFTFMQSVADFDEHLVAIIRQIRKTVRAYKDDPLYIYSVCVHPGTERFFQAIGFRADNWQQMLPSGHPLYRFTRR
jgi:hypothetical protein